MGRSILSAVALAIILLQAPLSNAQNTSSAAPCACQLSYMPVCDSSGAKYDNANCAVRCFGADEADLSPCEPEAPAGSAPADPCPCTLDWAPVCDSANVLLAPNACSAKCQGYTDAQIHPCATATPQKKASPPRPCVCTFEYMPVCDAQGLILAPSACTARCQGFDDSEFSVCASVPSPLPAVDTCICPFIYRPVCDKYGNEIAPSACTANCQGLKGFEPCDQFLSHQLLVPPMNPPKEDCMCTLEYAPVCTIDKQQVGANKCDALCKGFDESQLQPCRVPSISLVPFSAGGGSDDCACTMEWFPQCLPNGTQVGGNPCEAACNGFAGSFVPCALLDGLANGTISDVQPKPPCTCTKELDPHCTIPSEASPVPIPVGANKCNAECNGYSPDEIQPCDKAPVLAKNIADRLCPCPKIYLPVCDEHGTRLGDNACLAACKGYNESAFSPEYCTAPTVPSTCQDVACTFDYRPVCDAQGTELGSNACGANCKGYDSADYSEDFCSLEYTVQNVTRQVSSQGPCKCTKEYIPICDSKGTVVAPNPCTALCSNFNPPEYNPCFFIELPQSANTAAARTESAVDAELAKLGSATIQTVCTRSTESAGPLLCTTFDSGIGFQNGTNDAGDGSGDVDTGKDSSATAASSGRALSMHGALAISLAGLLRFLM